MGTKRPNGQGSYSNRNGRHIIQYSQDGKRFTKSFKTELEAHQVLEEIRKGTYKSSKIDKNKLNLDELFNLWIDSRDKTPYNYGCKVRFHKHWSPIIGKMRPNDLTITKLKESIGILKKNHLSKSSIGLLFRILSSFLSELVEDGIIKQNPVSQLSKKTRREFISEKDPAKIPFIKNKNDIERIFTWLDGQNHSVAIAFALGSQAGLRINEIRGLSWSDIDFENKLININWQAGTAADGPDKLRPPKDGTSRTVPMSDNLYSLLQQWFEKTQFGESKLVVRPPFSPDPDKKFIGKAQLKQMLDKCLKALGLPKLNWHRATRHTFACHYTTGGGSMVKLKEIMGHSSYATTERNYLHLVPGQFTDKDRNILDIKLNKHEVPIDFMLKNEYIGTIDTRKMTY
ncbi:MAG TPA: site-specific integrase [Legionellaceae bacterium]|nr:site-specific integrase [Legionellaceae bacterium]